MCLSRGGVADDGDGVVNELLKEQISQMHAFSQVRIRFFSSFFALSDIDCVGGIPENVYAKAVRDVSSKTGMKRLSRGG